MRVSGQRHAPAALYPRGKDPRYPLDRRLGGGWVGLRAGLDARTRRKILRPCRGSNLDHPIVQLVVRHYTTWATAAPHIPYLLHKSCVVLHLYGDLQWTSTTYRSVRKWKGPLRFRKTCTKWTLVGNTVSDCRPTHPFTRSVLRNYSTVRDNIW
jgi:hypothetical protein